MSINIQPAEEAPRCQRIREGKKPLRSCMICRRKDCAVWHDVLSIFDKTGETDIDSATTETKTQVHDSIIIGQIHGDKKNVNIEMPLEEILRDTIEI